MRVLIFTLAFLCLYTGAFAGPDKKQVKLRLQSHIGNLDETTVYFDYGVISDFKAQEDLQKTINNLPGIPVLYSVSKDNYKLANNGFSILNQSEVVALGVLVDSDGVYNFTAPFVDKFDATSILRLEDRNNGTFTDLRTNLYQANILANEPAEGRFFLHVSYPVSFVPSASGCQNNDGTIWVETEPTIQWTLCDLYDNTNTLRGTYSNANGGFDFTGLEEGDYYMVFVYGNYTTTKQFHINTNAIDANIFVSTVNAYAGEDINFHAVTQNATGFEWDFGDGTQIMGIANPTLSYYVSGTYTVTLKCTNLYGCEQEADANVNISEISGVKDVAGTNAIVSVSHGTVSVNLNDEVPNNATLKVFNLLGQSVYTGKITAQVTNIEMNNQPAGYYMVSINDAGKATTKKIFVSR
jgi:PKD repeat protein